ncbi:MAG: sugar phosphate isomerase/epimerase [Anaerolineaceae bacterium]|nr:sugar phosphate isomerase/epimerase [Anaerolineaceae bacterium]
MRLGGVDDWFSGWLNVDEQVVGELVALGFSGMGMHYPGDPLEQPLAEAMRTRQLLQDSGIELVQFWGAYPSIISRDESVRRAGLQVCRHVIQRAGELGAHMASLRPTSMYDGYQWAPHADNFLPETEERLVRSLAEIGEAAAQFGVPVAMECHLTTTLGEPAKIRRIIERSNPDWIGVNADVVNFVKDLDSVYNTTAVIDNFFDELGPCIRSAHLKDVTVGEQLVLHIEEAVPGTGLLDWDRLFRRFEALMPEGYVLIEHLRRLEDVRQARDFVVGRLAQLAIAIH